MVDRLLYDVLLCGCVARSQPPKVQKSKAAKLLAAQSASKGKGKKKVTQNAHEHGRRGNRFRHTIM